MTKSKNRSSVSTTMSSHKQNLKGFNVKSLLKDKDIGMENYLSKGINYLKGLKQ